MEARPCQVKAQLRPLGRPAVSTLYNCALRYTRRASHNTYKYAVRSAILLIFLLNASFYVVHVITHEIVCTAMFIFYQCYFRAEYGLEEEKKEATVDGSPRKRQITRVMGVNFAPASTPLRRRVQTFCVTLCSFSFLFSGPLFTMLVIYTLFTRLYWLTLVYVAWCVYDRSTHEQGGHRINWYRRWTFWKKVAEYFPARLEKTTDLPTDRNYVFGYHPHGIMAAGSFINFATEATGFSKLFPGISPHLMTLTMNFYFPFYRDLILGLGVVSVTRKSLNWILKNKGVGNAAIIVVGGAQEALDAHRNSDVTLTLTSRKGFVKIALQNGADLVPVFSFGENDVYQQAANPPGSRLRDIQERIKRVIGFSPPLFHGRGLLQYTWGYAPYRARITTVVGAPIAVTKVPNPTSEQVDELHAKYVAALKELFETHKASAGCDPQLKLTIY